MLVMRYQFMRRYRLDQTIVDLLRKGGYILYAKHGEATIGKEQVQIDIHDCATQRNLSDYGLGQAIDYGDKLRELEIPIDEIIASPLCRTMETALTAFDWDNVTVDPFWYEICSLHNHLPEKEASRLLETLTSKLEMPPRIGYNNIIIGHSFPVDIGLGRIPDMGTIVIKPKGQGEGYEIIAKLTFEDVMNLS